MANISIHTAKEYEALNQMSREDILNALQISYEANMLGTNYNGQPDYVGIGPDYLSYAVAQATSQAMEMLITLWDFFDELKDDDFEDNENGEGI